MSLLNVALWAAGAVLIAAAYRGASGPWARYQALKAQDENIARYEAWRGGVRDNERTGASVAMELLRARARNWLLVGLVGVVLVLAGFAVH
ncbi:MAG TPA: hypothetical protein VF763_14715 [Candidatus Limnocylindrales bacterium]